VSDPVSHPYQTTRKITILYIWIFFRTSPDRHWGPPSFLYNGYRLFPGGKVSQGVLLTTRPLLVLRSWKNRATPLPLLGHNRACNGVTLPFYILIFVFLDSKLKIKKDSVPNGSKHSLTSICS
jgi:hypothetical protein